MNDEWTPRDTFIAEATIILAGRCQPDAWAQLRRSLARLAVDEAATPESRSVALNEWRKLLEQETA